jgi:hypothetical protein
MAQVQYRIEASRDYPHIAWIDLHKDGVLHECAILKQNGDGNILFFQVNSLDEIDRRRLAGILADRNASNFELWDLMAQKTLGNGVNALAYFHQLVKVLSPAGKIMDPKSGQIGGIVAGQVNTAAV